MQASKTYKRDEIVKNKIAGRDSFDRPGEQRSKVTQARGYSTGE